MASQLPLDSIAVLWVFYERIPFLHVWEPHAGEVLALAGEPHKIVDQFAVAVVLSSSPFNLAAIFSHFLKRLFNKGTAEITDV